MALDDNLLAPEVVDDPHAFFHRLRHDDPVHWNERHRAWVITRYGDNAALFRDPRLSADRITPYFDHLSAEERDALEPTWRNLSRWIVFTDPPDHTRLRGLVNRAFTPRAVEALRARVGVITGELLDAVGGRDELDLVRDVAYPLPAIVIAEMLGAPPEDRDRFKGWSDDLSAVVFGAVDRPDRHEVAQRGLVEFDAYFGALVDRYRRHPADNLMTALVHARDGTGSLSTDEIIATCTLLLFAGHETTTNLIANGVLALLRQPDQLDRLRGQPGLIGTAVEEILRFDGPTRVMVRVVAEDVEVDGRRLRRGDKVFLSPMAANRDPAQFADPDHLDVARHPNPHLGFGFGAHYCLGAPLARLEGAVAIPAVLDRLPGLALGDRPPTWASTVIGRGMLSFPVRVGAPVTSA
jgi:cytochrome P450